MADNAPGSAPDSPLELGATGWRRTLARGVRKYLRDRCGMMAGSLAFHWFLSLFPALIAVVGITSMAHLGAGTVQRVVTGLNKALPPGRRACSARHCTPRTGGRVRDRSWW
jgi:uncharacterized BrkB/YihY/UPF0761 family membrane protein